MRGRITRAESSEEELEAVRMGVVEENQLLEMRADKYLQDAKSLFKTVEERDYGNWYPRRIKLR